MRIESTDVAVRHPRRERQWNRLQLLVTWAAGAIAIATAKNAGARRETRS